VCALWQAGVCHAGHREGSTAGLARAPRRRRCDFLVIRKEIITPRVLSAHWVFKCGFKCGNPPDTFMEDHQIVVPDVETDKNLADFFTKPLPARKFFELRKARMNEPNES